MQSVEILVNSANGLIREANVEYETLAHANTVARAKIEKNLKATLENLNQKVLEIQTAVTKLPIHEKGRYGKVINNLKNEVTRLSSLPKSRNIDKNVIELKRVPETDYSSMSENDLLRSQKEKKLKQDLDIDSLTEVAFRTKSTSREIGDELSLHNNLLDRTQSNVDHTNERLENVNQKLDRFLNSADKCSFASLCIIIILLMILIILTLTWL